MSEFRLSGKPKPQRKEPNPEVERSDQQRRLFFGMDDKPGQQYLYEMDGYETKETPVPPAES